MVLVTLVITVFMTLAFLALMLNRLQCKFGEKQGSVQSNVAEVKVTYLVTLNIDVVAV